MLVKAGKSWPEVGRKWDGSGTDVGRKCTTDMVFAFLQQAAAELVAVTKCVRIAKKPAKNPLLAQHRVICMHSGCTRQLHILVTLNLMMHHHQLVVKFVAIDPAAAPNPTQPAVLPNLKCATQWS